MADCSSHIQGQEGMDTVSGSSFSTDCDQCVAAVLCSEYGGQRIFYFPACIGCELDSDAVAPAEEPVKNEEARSVTKKSESVRQETAEPKPVKKEPAEKLDINTCSEEDFLTLPGMSLSLAKRAVEIRDTQGEYRSVDDFVARNGIKPHFMVQMESRVYVKEKVEKKTSESPKRGRMLDL